MAETAGGIVSALATSAATAAPTPAVTSATSAGPPPCQQGGVAEPKPVYPVSILRIGSLDVPMVLQ